jgi:valyl-tRNA synthetase
LLHPVMPFLTEELWQRLPGREQIHPQTICLAPYPQRERAWESAAVEKEIERFMQIVSWVRNLRAELRVEPRTEVTLFVHAEDSETRRFLTAMEPLAKPLARLAEVRLQEPPSAASRDVVGGLHLGLVVPERELSKEERARLAQEKEKLAAQIRRVSDLLANQEFLAKAPPAVIDQNRQRLRQMSERLERIEAGAVGS